MIQIADIREWRNHDVVDQDGKKIGSLENVYVDTATDAPSFATVTVGLPGRHRLVFVPITDAVAGPDYLRVPFGRGDVKNAPSIGTDDVLTAEQEPEVFAHYHLDYVTGAGGERRLARR
ncbi:PRC-barrel domain-containing protein [Kitasatospora fiedleri]|uniref:PRC-barrel domain-containing protein n=1 Tax=Kitasatospora fiedleri TaxID=2991545 RepID=UPI000C2B67D6|nr:PRC-barrel domain-containing protein [Kitasatospora fiedleri]